ncbi:hypothetical protein [Streptosporangium sp. NPDC000396]|uniref:hypothetical protein n=1 Tax=Streptosporangium sp. NPDC000396 TaxID=3366185 RepID=UPI0036A4D5C2
MQGFSRRVPLTTVLAVAAAGPAASAFQMNGVGQQFHLLSKYIPEAPQTPEELPVKWLVDNGYLKQLN